MYRLLGELQVILAQAVNHELTAAEFKEKVENIRNRSAEFHLQERADELIQQFLTDGRFALYSDSPE